MINSNDIFTIATKKEFEKIALKVFRFQFDNNKIYQEFCSLLKKKQRKCENSN